MFQVIDIPVPLVCPGWRGATSPANDPQQLQDRRNARGGYLDKPTGRGKQITMLTLRTAFKDKVGGTDHRCTAKQLLTRISMLQLWQAPERHRPTVTDDSERGAFSKSHGQGCVDLSAKCR